MEQRQPSPIDLLAGSNYIGCPLKPTSGFSAYDLLNELGSTYAETVARYDNPSGSWQSAYWFWGMPAGTDFAVRIGESYYIGCNYNCTLDFPGTIIGNCNYEFDLLDTHNLFSIPTPPYILGVSNDDEPRR